MESKDTIAKEESDKEGQPIEFLNRSAKALKLAKLYFDKAKIIAKKTTDYVQKIQNSHQSIELIASVLNKQIHVSLKSHLNTCLYISFYFHKKFEIMPFSEKLIFRIN